MYKNFAVCVVDDRCDDLDLQLSAGLGGGAAIVPNVVTYAYDVIAYVSSSRSAANGSHGNRVSGRHTGVMCGHAESLYTARGLWHGATKLSCRLCGPRQQG